MKRRVHCVRKKVTPRHRTVGMSRLNESEKKFLTLKFAINC